MWARFVSWLKTLFGKDDPEFSFNGVIKDVEDPRDYVFGEKDKS